MRTPLGSQLRRLRRTFGRHGATQNAKSAINQHARINAEIDDLANRLRAPSDAPEQAA